MSNIIKHVGSVDRVERFNSLQSGQYWRATTDIPEMGISLDDVLLIQSLRWVENQLHTVILRAHPQYYGKRKTLKWVDDTGKTCEQNVQMVEHRFLFDDFLGKFQFAPDHRSVRDAEVATCQQRVTDLTKNLSETLASAEKMKQIVAKKLEEHAEKNKITGVQFPMVRDEITHLATGSLSNALASGITESHIDQMRDAAKQNLQVATIQSKWIQDRNTEISAAVQAIVPYFEEMAAAQLATTEDARDQVDKLMNGIQSLDLYIGKNVDVYPIAKGESAPFDEPLTFVQRKLMVDEELAVYLDLSKWFDFSKMDLFHQALKDNPGLVEQIFPAKRCVLVMATTRRYIDYKDRWENMVNNGKNACVFLMVRDGENIYQIYSSVESHLGAHTLFPSEDEQSNLFRGMDGEQIHFQDVSYSDRLKNHEEMSLHYKRFLILCCGLDHRERLFGEFYDRNSSINFVSMKFQEEHCRFIHDHDGSGMLDNPMNKIMPSLRQYIEQANQHLRSGSRVMCQWRVISNPETAPGTAKVDTSRDRYSSYNFTVDFPQDRSVSVAYRKEDKIYVDVAVGKHVYSRNSKNDYQQFNAKVCLSLVNNKWSEDTERLGFLCLDAVKAEDLEYYIKSRSIRANHTYYIGLFKELVAYLRNERSEEQVHREKLLRALNVGNIGLPEDRDAIVDKTVISWRSANRGVPLSQALVEPKQWDNLLGMMDLIAWRGISQLPALEYFASIKGNAPLRLTVNSKGKLSLYMAPSADERDDRIEPHKWAHRVTFNLTAKGIKEASRTWALVSQHNVSETTLHEWDSVKEWKGLKSVFHSFDKKIRALNLIESSKENLARLHPTNQAGLGVLADLWVDAYREMNDNRATGGYVQLPAMMFPIGIITSGTEWEYIYLGSCNRAHNVLYHLAKEECVKDMIGHTLISSYESKEGKIKEMKASKDKLYLFVSTEEPDMDMYSANRNIITHSLSYSAELSVQEKISSIDTNWRLAVEEMSDKHGYRKSNLYLAESLRNASGNPDIDRILGNDLIVHEPVEVIEVTLPKSDKDRQHATIAETGEPYYLTHWFDIGPVGFDEELCLTGLKAPVRTMVRTSFPSEEAALTHILTLGKRLRKHTTDHFTKGDPSTPAGLTRWRFR